MTSYRSCVRLTLCAVALLFHSGPMPARAADTVRVGVGAVYPTYAVFFGGSQLGIYKKYDLDVQLTTFRGGPATQEALAAGSIDISAIAPAVVNLAIKKGVREQIVALFTPPVPDGWFIMVPKASPIKTMADLNGKTVAVTQKVSLTDYWANRAASIAGVTINTVPLGGGVVPGVKAKQVDAGIIWPIYSYKAMADDTLRPVFSLSEKLPPSISEGVAVSQDMIDKHPDVLKRWLAATSETISALQANEGKAEEVLKDYFKEDNPEVLKSVYKDFIMNIHPDGIMKKEWMEDSLQAAAFFGDKDPLSVDKIFSGAFTPIEAK